MKSTQRARTQLARAICRTLQSYDLERQAAHSADSFLPKRALRVCAVGKSAAAMAKGIESIREVEDGLVIVPREGGAVDLPRRWRIMRAAHPIPDLSSVAAGEALLAFVQQSTTPIAFLISGGASSLACVPHSGTSLGEKKKLTRALLSCGANIREINTVRKHLSAIKGGALLRASCAPLYTICVSDVIGGSISEIGSGPSVVDTSTVADARRIVTRYGLPEQPFRPTPSLHLRPRAKRIASPETFVRYVARELASLGRVSVQRSRIESLSEAVSRMKRIARRLKVGEIVVYAAEPTVSLPRKVGSGGRSCHLAAVVARDLPAGVIVGAIATDGQDGSSGLAGAVVDRSLAAHNAYDGAIAGFSTGDLHRQAGTCIDIGPTGINFADVHLLMRV